MVVDGDRARTHVDPHAVAGLELKPFEVPNPTASTDDATPILAKARAAYVDGNFDACRNELAKLDLAQLLAAGQRAAAGRAIAFDAACADGAKAKAQAEVLAVKLASLGLDMPDAPLAREAETLIATAITNIGKAPRHALAVSGEVGARLAVDGKPAGCTLPCTIDLPQGEHFVAVDADGFIAASQWVRVPDAKTVTITQSPATQAVANEQWHARIGRGLPADDATGAKLLAALSAQPRVVYLRGDKRVAGTMIVDGKIGATDEATDATALVRDLAYDAHLLERPKIYQRPSFWIATSLAVVVAAGIVVYAVYEPDVKSNLRFPQ